MSNKKEVKKSDGKRADSKKSDAVLLFWGSLADVTKWFMLAILALFPLLPGTDQVYYNLTVAKYTYFLIITGLYIAAAVYVALVAKPKEKGILHFRRLNISQIFLIAYLAWTLLTSVISKYPFFNDNFIGQSRYEAFLSIFLYGLIFIFVSYFAKDDDILAAGSNIMCIVMGGLACVQCFAVNILYPGDYNYFNSMFLTTIGNADCYSGVISIFIPLSFVSYVLSEKKIRFLSLPAILLTFYAQCFCEVDSGKIGLLAAFIVFIAFVCDTPKRLARTMQAGSVMIFAYSMYALFGNTDEYGIQVTADKRFAAALIASIAVAAAGILFERFWGNKEFKLSPAKIRTIIILFIVICIVAGLVFVYTYKGDMLLFKEASEVLHGNLTNEAGTYRGYIWKSSFEILKQHPLFGIGPGTFKTEFEPYNEGYHQYAPNTNVDFAHCDYLQIAVCQGSIGLILYLCFVISLIVRALKHAWKDPRIVIYLGACIGFLAHTLFGFSIAIVSPMFWVCAGLADSLICAAEQNEIKTKTTEKQKN